MEQLIIDAYSTLQQRWKCGTCCLQGIDPRIEKMCHRITHFYLSILVALLKNYGNGLRDYPVQPLERLQVSYYLFHLPTSSAWLKYQSFSKKFSVPLILQTCQTSMRYDTRDLWMINSSCFSICCFSCNYFVLLLRKVDSNTKIENNTEFSGKD